VCVFFTIFDYGTHFKVNCADMAGNRPGNPASRNCQGCRASGELCSNYLFYLSHVVGLCVLRINYFDSINIVMHACEHVCEFFVGHYTFYFYFCVPPIFGE